MITVENKLIEMPYIDYSNKVFDLELEKLKSVEAIIDYIIDILKGKKFKDKYNNVIEIKSLRDKQEFLNELKHNYIFNNIVKSKFSNNEKKLLSVIMDI